jgi:hypothetical protein
MRENACFNEGIEEYLEDVANSIKCEERFGLV